MDPKMQRPEPKNRLETGGQESNGRSIARDEAMKRIIKQHPQRDIPRVESIEPPGAPETPKAPEAPEAPPKE